MMNEKTSSARVVLENIPCAIFLSLPFFPHPASLSFSLSFSLVTPGTNSNKRTSSAHGWSYAAWKMENTPRKHDPPRPSETRCRGGFCRWRVVVVGGVRQRFAPSWLRAFPPKLQGWIIVWRFTDECRSSYNCNEP